MISSGNQEGPQPTEKQLLTDVLSKTCTDIGFSMATALFQWFVSAQFWAPDRIIPYGVYECKSEVERGLFPAPLLRCEHIFL